MDNLQINGLKVIQKRGLKILLLVDAICKENNLRYFLDSGTLLGAVRHKGFIPWDDDVDIAMPRADYESFVKIASKELQEHYFVQTNASDPYFPFGFARILDTKSKFKENNNKFRTGFCIDVFPIDNAHDNKLLHKFNILIIKIIQALTKSKIKLDMSNYNGFAIKIAVIISSTVGKLFPTSFLMSAQKKIATANNNKKTKNKCIYSYSFRYLNLLFPSDVFSGTEMLEFEGYVFPAPKGWDELLTKLYGDYFKLPPLEKEYPHTALGTLSFQMTNK